jgi:hypothetical protein
MNVFPAADPHAGRRGTTSHVPVEPEIRRATGESLTISATSTVSLQTFRVGWDL